MFRAPQSPQRYSTPRITGRVPAVVGPAVEGLVVFIIIMSVDQCEAVLDDDLENCTEKRRWLLLCEMGGCDDC